MKRKKKNKNAHATTHRCSSNRNRAKNDSHSDRPKKETRASIWQNVKCSVVVPDVEVYAAHVISKQISSLYYIITPR